VAPAAPGPTATMTGCNIAEPTGSAAKALRWPPVPDDSGPRSYQSDTNVRGAPARDACACTYKRRANGWQWAD
jgi:hypothetical protein